MSRKKIALLIILLGIFINIISLPFIQNYNPRLGWVGSMDRMEIVLNHGTKIEEAPWPPGVTQPPPTKPNNDLEQRELGSRLNREINAKLYPEAQNLDKYNTGRVAFSYRYVFVIGILLVFAGGSLIILSPEVKSKKRNEF